MRARRARRRSRERGLAHAARFRDARDLVVRAVRRDVGIDAAGARGDEVRRDRTGRIRVLLLERGDGRWSNRSASLRSVRGSCRRSASDRSRSCRPPTDGRGNTAASSKVWPMISEPIGLRRSMTIEPLAWCGKSDDPDQPDHRRIDETERDDRDDR